VIAGDAGDAPVFRMDFSDPTSAIDTLLAETPSQSIPHRSKDHAVENSFVILVATILVALLLSNMFLYQVRYDQVAVRTTFDRADESSVQDAPGLKWRWPWPINKVSLYSKRLQVLDDKIEELQTADGKSVIIKTYLTWRIADPLAFYVTLKDPTEANRQMASQLREIRGLISNYDFDELVNVDRSKLKLAAIEEEATGRSTRHCGRLDTAFGWRASGSTR